MKALQQCIFILSRPKEAYDVIYNTFKGCAIIHPVDAKPFTRHASSTEGTNYAIIVQNSTEWRFIQLESEIYEPM